VRKRAVVAADELERHIMRCRRRQEPASVLVVRVVAPGRIGPEWLRACFRLTDSVAIARTRYGYELKGVFDEDGLDRDALEWRLRAALDGMPTCVSWARFPDDGVTLEIVLERARVGLPVPAGHHSRRRAGALHLWAARAPSGSEGE
jgi:hypothetical protein